MLSAISAVVPAMDMLPWRFVEPMVEKRLFVSNDVLGL